MHTQPLALRRVGPCPEFSTNVRAFLKRLLPVLGAIGASEGHSMKHVLSLHNHETLRKQLDFYLRIHRH